MHHVVFLQTCYCPPPEFDFPHKRTEYYDTQPGQAAERIKDASIVVTVLLPITPEMIRQCTPGILRQVVVMATGCGWIDHDFYKEMGITACNCPHTNISAVSEHTLGLYIASRKRIVEMHNRVTATDEWAQHTTLKGKFPLGPPPSCSQETIGIIGYGALGKAIERLFRAVGAGTILIAERKGMTPRPGRTTFETIIHEASVIIVCCPKDPETIDLITMTELKMMRADALVINMARGGIVNEKDLAQALRERRIDTAATDVLEEEPGIRGKSPLLPAEGEGPIPGLTISPHISWFAQQTIINLQTFLKAGVEGFVAGVPVNVVVKG